VLQGAVTISHLNPTPGISRTLKTQDTSTILHTYPAAAMSQRLCSMRCLYPRLENGRKDFQLNSYRITLSISLSACRTGRLYIPSPAGSIALFQVQCQGPIERCFFVHQKAG
jgi:hypothetical protein